MTPGLTMLLGWTTCFAAAMLFALSGRPGAHARAAAVMMGSLAVAMLLASVGTVTLAVAAFVWGGVVALRLARSSARPTPGARRGVDAGAPSSLTSVDAEDSWGRRLALAVAWALVAVVGVGTVVRLYVTFGADLSLHPTFGSREVVLRGVFVAQPVLPMLIGLALLLKTLVARERSASRTASPESRAPVIEPDARGDT